MKLFKNLFMTAMLAVLICGLTGCGGNSRQVVLYTNADDEAVTAMKNALTATAMAANIFCKALEPRSLEASFWQKEKMLRPI